MNSEYDFEILLTCQVVSLGQQAFLSDSLITSLPWNIPPWQTEVRSVLRRRSLLIMASWEFHLVTTSCMRVSGTLVPLSIWIFSRASLAVMRQHGIGKYSMIYSECKCFNTINDKLIITRCGPVEESHKLAGSGQSSHDGAILGLSSRLAKPQAIIDGKL